MSNRKQRVVINGVVSEWAPVTSGVPQGSVLAPVMFRISINDVDVGLNNLISKFADDTKISKSVLTDDRVCLQKALHTISAWSETLEMPFSIGKWQVHQVRSNDKKYYYEMCGVKIKSVQCAKDLGVRIASDPKFSQQCNNAANKAYNVGFYQKKLFI